MRTLFSLVVAAVSVSAVAVARVDDDPIKVKLDKAKLAYEATHVKAKQNVLDIFEKREEAARKDGNKKLVDQIKAERLAYEDAGELPKSMPVAMKQKLAAAKVALEAAYALAIKEYTKAKMDDDATAIEAELAAFKSGAAAGVPPVPEAGKDDYCALFSRLGHWAVVSEKERDGLQVHTGDPAKGSKAHHWKVLPAEDKYVYLVAENGKYVGTARNGKGDGAEVVVAEKKSGDALLNQQWKILPSSEKGWSKIIHRTSGKAIGVDAGSSKVGMRLLIWEDRDSPSAMWRTEKVKSP